MAKEHRNAHRKPVTQALLRLEIGCPSFCIQDSCDRRSFAKRIVEGELKHYYRDHLQTPFIVWLAGKGASGCKHKIQHETAEQRMHRKGLSLYPL